MTTRVLITGATGFVGSHVAASFQKSGYQVHVAVRPQSSMAQLEALGVRAQVHRPAETMDGLCSLLEEVRPELVCHLAALFLVEHRPEDLDRMLNGNLIFATRLVEAMRCCGVPYLLNTGTAWQHYHNEAYHPVNLYAAMKQGFEDLLRYYVEAHGLRVLTLKLFDTYGPLDPRAKLVSLLLRLAANPEGLEMSPGEQLIDIVHVADVAAAFQLAALRLLQHTGELSESFAVSSGAPISLREFVTLFETCCGCPLPIRWGGRPYRQREVMCPWSNGRSLPGWQPVVSLRQGLMECIAAAGIDSTHCRSTA